MAWASGCSARALLPAGRVTVVPPPSIVIHLLAFLSASLHSDLGLDLRAVLSQGLLTAPIIMLSVC